MVKSSPAARKMIAQVKKLLADIEHKHLEIGGLLREMRGKAWLTGRDFREVLSHDIGIHYRKAMYLMACHKAYADGLVTKEEAASMGWSKLAIIAPHLTPSNKRDLISKSRAKSTHELRSLVYGGEDNLSYVSFKLNPKDKELLYKALIKRGARRSNRRGGSLEGKEAALLCLLRHSSEVVKVDFKLKKKAA